MQPWWCARRIAALSQCSRYPFNRMQRALLVGLAQHRSTQGMPGCHKAESAHASHATGSVGAHLRHQALGLAVHPAGLPCPGLHDARVLRAGQRHRVRHSDRRSSRGLQVLHSSCISVRASAQFLQALLKASLLAGLCRIAHRFIHVSAGQRP